MFDDIDNPEKRKYDGSPAIIIQAEAERSGIKVPGITIPKCCGQIEPCRHVVNRSEFRVRKGNIGL